MGVRAEAGVGRPAGAVVLLGLAGAIAAWLARGRLGPAVTPGVVVGALLATAGAVAGLMLTAWSFDKEPRWFLGSMVFGILARLFVFGAALVYVALRTTIDPVATAGTLLGCYVLFQIIEVRFAMRGLAGGR